MKLDLPSNQEAWCQTCGRTVFWLAVDDNQRHTCGSKVSIRERSK